MSKARLALTIASILSTSLLAGCSNPQPGPDKTLAGAVLGAGWGAGAGAVVGNQISYAGEGAAVGAGFGLVGGALTGAGFDLTESSQLRQEKQLAALKIQNASNSRQLTILQSKLDRAVDSDLAGGIYQVFFDTDETSMRAGAIANLENIAEQIKRTPHLSVVNVSGHSDDAGTPEYNERLAEARARSVSAYLASRGIAIDQISVKSYGSQRPIASNTTQTGRQLNRRVDIFISR